MCWRLSLLLVGLAGIAPAHDVISTKITFSKEISRLVNKNCASCHREGGSSFSLVKYEEARPWAKAIKEEVLSRRMPPWNAVKGFGEFADDRGLTQEQIELFADWVEGGAPEGDPQYLPKKPSRMEEAVRPVLGRGMAVNGQLRLASTTDLRAIQPAALPPGGALQVIAALPDGSIEPLLWVQAFNPSYNQPYRFRTPLKLPAGTVIRTAPASGHVTVFAKVAPPKPSN